MMPDSETQIDQLTAVFGTQVALAEAAGIDSRNVTEWRRRNLGVPAKHYRALFFAAVEIEKQDELPEWFPVFRVDDAA